MCFFGGGSPAPAPTPAAPPKLPEAPVTPTDNSGKAGQADSIRRRAAAGKSRATSNILSSPLGISDAQQSQTSLGTKTLLGA